MSSDISGSRLFSSYRGLGLVSNDIPLVVRYIKRTKETIITTVIGNSIQTYDSSKLRLKNVGNPHLQPIVCISGDVYHVYTACNDTLYAWRRTTELIHKYPNHADVIKLIQPFGPHVISIDRKNILYVWDIKSEELFLQMQFPKKFQITTILHPATYINKILLGAEDGTLQLWNIQSTKLIYSFAGWDSKVTVLEQAPAVDVVAIGLDNGEIYLHNLKFDETVVKFEQDWGPITAIGFRTDGQPVMVSGSLLGHIAIWDLHERRLSSHIQNAHKKAVTGLKVLQNEPRMVTSSPDNTLKIWIFDMPDGGARQLVVREGHSAPPLMARFHGLLGEHILTAGEDSTMRVFSTVTDDLNRSMGEASFNRKAAKKHKSVRADLKMPPIVGFTSETTQEKPWDNIACIHRDLTAVTTWSFENQKMGDLKLKHERFKEVKNRSTLATCVVLSVCGNYIVIGYDSGHMDKYNIQSGLFRGSFVDPLIGLAHEDMISGVVTNGLNQLVVSGDIRGNLKWWKFKRLEKLHELNFEMGIAVLKLHRESGLLAIALDNWCLHVVDIDTKIVIRNLTGHSNQVTDLAFSPDSRWLISASLDRSIRTWDLPSSSCIDMFCVPIAATSIDMSPTGEFLATIHAGQLGVYLWANRGCFQLVSPFPLPDEFVPRLLPLPSVGVDESEFVLAEGEEDKEEPTEEMETEDEYQSPEQISEDLITLALMPTSRWLNLLHLDTIKKRNAPAEPPKAPKAAPFFIPTVSGLNFKFETTENKDQQDSKDSGGSRMKTVTNFESLTPFGEELKTKNYDKAMEMLLSMGPSAIDVEIRELDPAAGGSEEVVLNFLKMMKHSVTKKRYFEVTQGYLGLFLKIHADFLVANEEAQEICHKLLISNKNSWLSLKNSLNQSLSLLSYLKNAAVINY